MTKAFDMLTQGLDEVEAYLEGDRAGFVVHIPHEVDVKAIRTHLKLSQPKFAATFGFSVGRIRDWEQKRFPVDAPSRAFLTVIAKEPTAVMRALQTTGTHPTKARAVAAAKDRGKPPAAMASRSRPASRARVVAAKA